MLARRRRRRWGGGFGRLEVEGGCVLGVILLSKVCFSYLIYLKWLRDVDLLCLVEMKLITAAIYTNFTTHVVNDEGIEQIDAYTAGPRSNRLLLRFERVE